MAALSTKQLTSMLKGTVTNCVVLGVFPGDMVPMKLTDGHLCHSGGDSTPVAVNTNYCFILNTHAHVDPGEHWLAFFNNADTNTLEYFDSFGLPTDMYEVVHTALGASNLLAMCKPANTRGFLQSIGSEVCGQYCVAFLHWRAKHAHAPITRFTDIVAHVGSAPQRDTYIVSYVRGLVKCSTCCTSHHDVVCNQSCVCPNRVCAQSRSAKYIK